MKFKRNFQLFAAAMMLFLLAFPAISMSGAKTDFSGTWVYNESQSEVGESRYGGPSAEMIATQEGMNLTIETTRRNRDGEERKITRKVSLDGKETTDESERRTVTAKATWSDDGKSLTIKSHTKMTRQDQTYEIGHSRNLDTG